MRKKIIIFHSIFFGLSETFIYRQIKGLQKDFQIGLMGYRFLNKDIFPLDSVSEYKISNYENWIDRLCSAVYRKIVDNDLKFSLLNFFKIQRLLKRNQFYAIHAHYGRNGLKILPLARRYKIPLIVSFHGNDASKALQNQTYVKRLPYLFEYAHAIVICSTHMIDALKLDRWKDKVHVVHYGIDSNEFKPFTIEGERYQGIKIVHSGRLASKKGVPDLILVFSDLIKKFPDIRLEILGDGKDREKCQTMVETLQLQPYIFFHGAKPQPFVKQVINEADIFVLNSRTAENGDMEGLPNSILEAMSMEKAVVSTRHAGIPEAIEHGVNGLLVHEKSNDELYAALEKLILDSPLRKQLAKEARKTILNSFTIDVMMNKLKEVYNRIPDV